MQRKLRDRRPSCASADNSTPRNTTTFSAHALKRKYAFMLPRRHQLTHTPSAQTMLAVAGGTQDLPTKRALHVHLFDPA